MHRVHELIGSILVEEVEEHKHGVLQDGRRLQNDVRLGLKVLWAKRGDILAVDDDLSLRASDDRKSISSFELFPYPYG